MSTSALPTLQQILPLLIPIVLVELILMVVAIVDLIRSKTVRGPKWVWALVILFIQIIGPIVYLTLGRKEA